MTSPTWEIRQGDLGLGMCADLPPQKRGLRAYGDRLTADVNQKGVLDVDTVKGCSAGMSTRPDGGCYNACYAAKIAAFRGIDFSRHVVRIVHGPAHARQIEKAVRAAPNGFFRVGTMGDPSHAWTHTVRIIEWLATLAVPVVVTKHWRAIDDGDLCRLVECGTVLNTSISALDTPAELVHRRRQIARYAAFGGISVSRIVSCDFNTATAVGARLSALQSELFSSSEHVIDNPLRIPRTHRLVTDGLIRVQMRRDLGSRPVPISITRKDAYVGHCSNCPDLCGLAVCSPQHPRPALPQLDIFEQRSGTGE